MSDTTSTGQTLSRRVRVRCAALLLGTSLATILATPAFATGDTWQGGGSSNNWSDGGNWTSGTPSNGQDITIGQISGDHAPSNFDISLQAKSLTLDTSTDPTTQANGYVINNGGGTFSLQSGGTITDNATHAIADQLNIGVGLNGPTTFALGSGATGLTVGGNVTGAGPLTIDNESSTGIITLSGINTYTGGTTISHGILSVGADANLGDLSGGIAINNGSTLQMTQGFLTARTVSLGTGTEIIDTLSAPNASYIFSGVISGNGGLKKTSGGTLILTNNDTYKGGTEVAAGELSLGSFGGSTSGSVTGNIVLDNNTTLAFNRTDDISISNQISGAGGVVKNFGNTLTYLVDETYTGSTTVAAGNLQLGDGGTGGSVAGDIVLSGTVDPHGVIQTFTTVIFNHSNDISYGGNISGIGALDKKGSDTLTLTGTNSFLSGTTIEGGTLQIGNGGTAGSLSGDVADGGTLAFDLTSSVTENGNITGTGSLVQKGSGTTILTGTDTYSGGTTISSGTLQIGNGGSTGSIVGDITDNGALKVNLGNTITITPGGPVVTPTLLQFDGKITGTGSFEQAGTGFTTFTNDNTYSGGTTISAGTLQLGNGGTTGSVQGDITDNAALIFARSDNYTYGNVISGTGTVNQDGPGSLILTNDNTYTGGTTISGGKLVIGDGGGDGSIKGDVVDNAELDFNSGEAQTFGGVISGTGSVHTTNVNDVEVLTGTNTYSGGTFIDQGVLFIGNGGTTGSIVGDVTDNGNLVFERSDKITFGGTISGSGAVNQSGSGTLVLSGTNTYTGDTNLNSGTLSISADDNLGSGGTLRMQPGTTLDITASGTYTHSVTLSGDPTFNVASGTTDVWSGEIDDFGSPGDHGTLEVTGGGTLYLTNTSNTYSGGTNVHGNSTLKIDFDDNLGAVNTLQLGDATTAGTLEISDTMTMSTARNITLGAGGGTIQTDSGTAELDDVIGGAGKLTKTGAGTLILGGSNTYNGGTTISAGILQIGDGATGGSVVGAILDNAELDFNRTDVVAELGNITGTGSVHQIGSGTTILTGANTYSGGTTIAAGSLQIGNGGTTGSIIGNVTDNANLAFDRSDTVTFGGAISGTGSLTQLGGGALILTNADTYSGQTIISSGTLQIGTGGLSGSIASQDVQDSGILAFDRSDNVTYSGVISQGGSLQQIGPGTLILTGDNTYTGGTTITAGTLQLGNGGTSGAIAGAVTDNAALVFDRSDDTTFAGDISGTGSVSQSGTNTTTLTGDDTYSGGTTINSGTLQIGDGTTVGFISGNVTDNGTLAFNHSDDVTFAGAITGSGKLTKLGAGKLILTGANTYSGVTTISAGTLQLGNGGSSGSITSNVTDNGVFAVDRSDKFTYSGNVTGTGSLQQVGTGTLILTGSNSYSGGTTISGGTLQVGNGSSAGAITGDITDNAALSFDRNDSITEGGVISGTGTVSQIGTGTTTLTGISTYSGATSVNNGTLAVNGSIANSHVTVNASGTLAGTGTVGSLEVANGGAVAPGNGGVGTLNVGGSLTLDAASKYLVDSTSAATDELKVSGTAALNGTLVVTPTGGGYAYGQHIVVVNATGGVSGTFASFSSGSFGSNIAAVLGYDANDAFLTLVPDAITPLLSGTGTRNEKSVAGAIDFAIQHDGAALVFGPFGSLSPSQAAAVLDQMDGEVGPSVQNAIDNSMANFIDRLLDPAVGGRDGLGDGAGYTLASNQPNEQLAYDGPNPPYEHTPHREFAVWSDFHGGGESTQANPIVGTHDMSATNAGGEIGFNYTPYSGLGAIGVAFGYDTTDWTLGDNIGKGRSNAYQIGAYYSRMFGPNYISAAGAYAVYNVKTDRTVIFGGTNNYEAKFTGQSSSARFEYGHIFLTNGGDELIPYVNAQAGDLYTPNYTEKTLSGSPSFALAYTQKQHFDYTSELGLAWNTVVSRGNGSITELQTRLGWEHDFVSGLKDTATFAAFSGSNFTVQGAPPPQNAAHVSLGVEHEWDNIALGLNLNGMLAGSSQTYDGTASVSFHW